MAAVHGDWKRRATSLAAATKAAARGRFVSGKKSEGTGCAATQHPRQSYRHRSGRYTPDFSGSLLVTAVFNTLVPPTETLHAARRIDDLLLPREKRMAGRTDLNVQLRSGRTRLDHIAAQTADLAVDVLGMYAIFHVSTAF
jgi:hypothetical protein